MVIARRPSQAREASLKASLVDKDFKHQSLDLDMETHASAPSYMSLKILLTLSLINKWDVVTADTSPALLQAPIASDELVLVKPPPELEQDPDVLWKLTKALYGFTSPKLWQQHMASKLEELGLRKNKVEPCIFTSEQLIVIHHLDALLVGGDKHHQESFITKLSAHISLKDIAKLDAKTLLIILGPGVQQARAQHQLASTSILLHEAFEDAWHGGSKSNKHTSRSALSIRRTEEQQDLGLSKTQALQNSS